jgi:D-alanyl-lipoteichoic acid acyltransferase DltB (MBOAT superfamily)
MPSPGLDYGFIAIVVSALAAYYMPFLRRPTGYLLLTVAVAIFTCGSAIIGYAICIVALFLFVWLAEYFSRPESQARIRWSYACGAMFAALALFLAQSWHLLDRLQIRAFNIAWTLPQHDMWLLVRVLSFLWEFGSGRVPTPGFVTYLIWVLLPFTSRGPFLRYSEFYPQYLQPNAAHRTVPPMTDTWWQRLGLAILQMICGLALLYLSPVLYSMPRRWPKLLIIFGTGPWSFYLSMGGTYHLMECMSALWGIELPLSFNFPFGQPNLSEFWARWNMTITRVCRDYLFYNRWGLRRINVYLNLMILFFAIGLWHSANYYWVTWGLFHGAGFCAYMYYRTHREKFDFLRELASDRIRDGVSRTITYSFVCLAWYVATKIALLLLRIDLPYHLY